jgi:DNA segregation ATPase FtsK/SpoIIIE-like protein
MAFNFFRKLFNPSEYIEADETEPIEDVALVEEQKADVSTNVSVSTPIEKTSEKKAVKIEQNKIDVPNIQSTRVKPVDEPPIIAGPINPFEPFTRYSFPDTKQLIPYTDHEDNFVPFSQIIESDDFKTCNYHIPIALGKGEKGIAIFDLTKAPNVLIGGASGQGKSVAIHTMICSLLYKLHPNLVKFIFADPNGIEFSSYHKISDKYFAVPEEKEFDEPSTISSAEDLVSILESLSKLADKRLDLMKDAATRNILDYNKKFVNRHLNPAKGHEYMPYVLLFVDEFSTFLSQSRRQIEEALSRLTMKARTTGIHLIFSTQFCTSENISQNIKSCFPARIAFRTLSGTESRVILDCSDAKDLTNFGQMILSLNGLKSVIQGAYIDSGEIDNITDYINQQFGPISPYLIPNAKEESTTIQSSDLSSNDPLFEEAARHVVLTQQASTSVLQRKFVIGYNRCGRIMDQLEQADIVGPPQGSKPREVLIRDLFSLENILASPTKAHEKLSFNRTELDPLFNEAAKHIVWLGIGSTSALQRRFSLGYNRATRIMEQLEKAGIVGPSKSVGLRDVLVKDEQSLESILSIRH